MLYLFQQLLFKLKAQTAHGLHSPLVFDLYTKVINPNLVSFSKEKMLKELQNYSRTKIELENFKLLIINSIDEFKTIKVNQKQIIYIDQPYRTNEFLTMTKKLADEEQINYVIQFFFGTILIASNLAPKQVFYLKKMK